MTRGERARSGRLPPSPGPFPRCGGRGEGRIVSTSADVPDRDTSGHRSFTISSPSPIRGKGRGMGAQRVDRDRDPDRDRDRDPDRDRDRDPDPDPDRDPDPDPYRDPDPDPYRRRRIRIATTPPMGSGSGSMGGSANTRRSMMGSPSRSERSARSSSKALS